MLLSDTCTTELTLPGFRNEDAKEWLQLSLAAEDPAAEETQVPVGVSEVVYGRQP